MGVMDTERARTLRKHLTEAEQRLWQKLKRRQLAGMKFRRQQPIGPFIVDFVCFECRVIVEVDGGQHAEQVPYDMDRSGWLETRGYRVLRFWNNEVLAHPEAVAQVILDCVKEGIDPLNPPPQGGGNELKLPRKGEELRRSSC